MDAFRTWRRRWVLTSFMLLLALVGTTAAVLKAPRVYQATATVVLLTSHNASKATGGGNPYLSFTDSLSTTASVITSEVTDPQSASNLKMRGYAESYQVVSQSALSNITQLPAPFLLITVTGNNGWLVEHTLHGVANQISIALNGLQSGVSRNNRISLITSSFSPKAGLSLTSTARPLVIILGLLLVSALAIPLLVDARSARGRLRRSASRLPVGGTSDRRSVPAQSSGSSRRGGRPGEAAGLSVTSHQGDERYRHPADPKFVGGG